MISNNLKMMIDFNQSKDFVNKILCLLEEAECSSWINWLIKLPSKKPKELKETYMNLSGSQQDQVDLLPPQEAKALLRKLGKPRPQPTES